MSMFRNWLGTNPGPIGIDLGTETLKLAQASAAGKGPGRELVAAASAPVPPNARGEFRARVAFFQQAIPKLLADGAFRGRRALIALPSSCMHVYRLRVPAMDEQRLHGTIAFELQGKLPIDPARAMMRHVIAGEAYENDEPVDEVIVMAAERSLMEQLLGAAARAKLDVIGVTAEPQATLDCFASAYAGTPLAGATRLYVDIGVRATRAYIARGPQLLFARVIATGADDFAQAVASALNVTPGAARELRRRHGAAPAARAAQAAEKRASSSTDDGATATAVAAPPQVDPAITSMIAACAPLGRALCDELHMCIRYCEHTFPAWPVEHVCFVGGEANNHALCRQLAAHLDLPAQIGDPLAKLKPTRPIPGLDHTRPQPAWTVAVGLAVGSVG